MRLCRELVGDGLDDALDGKGSYREPKKEKKHHKKLQIVWSVVTANLNVWFFVFLMVTGVPQQGLTHTLPHKRERADKGLLLLYKAIPVLLDEIPDKQVTSEAARHPADDQGQLLGLDDATLQTFM